MGDLEGWKANFLEEESPPSAHPVCLAIDICIDQWAIAELRTKDLISRIQPTIDSEKRRNAVVQYVQRLVRQCIGCEVFTFGSVPLKTYLPDGDIDLTAFSKYHDVNNTWASDVRSVLQEEEQRVDGEFRVKDVQYIHAEVKLVKCLIENIVVDISFNQLGGLCTLCFLEQVNELIGKDNLFKRSIILVKAWCYYESRILGAHHGLISTYALETLVLYIFHIFHAMVRSPLEVLFKFLDFFSKFDWDNYCLSIQGPIPKSALPEIAAEPPQTNGGNVLLSKEFLKVCSERYSVFPKGQDNPIQAFSAKHLNIVDPLRENNNLGRSVSKANFHRIRSALGYGARKLANIIQSPEEKISGELDKFFMNTWERHGGGRRPDVPELKSQGSTSNLSVKSESFIVFSRSITDNGYLHLNPFGESASESPNAHDTSYFVPGGNKLSDVRNSSCILADDGSQISGGTSSDSVQCTSDAPIQIINSFDSNFRNTVSNYCNSSIECGLLEDGHAVTQKSKTDYASVIGHDDLLCSADYGHVSHSEDTETSSFVPTLFVEEELTLGRHDFPQNSVSGSVAQTYPIPDYPKLNFGRHFTSHILDQPVFSGHAYPFQASHRPLPSGKQASSFAFGGSDTLKSLLSHHPMAEGIAFNSYAYCPPDTHNSFNLIQAGGSLFKALGNGNEVNQLEILNNKKANKITHTSSTQMVESDVEIMSSSSSPSLESMLVRGVDGLSGSKSDLLNGDYRHHLNSLAYGRSCHDHVWPVSLLPFPAAPCYAQEHCLWEGPGRPVHSNMTMPNHVRGQGVVFCHPLHYPSGYPGANYRIQSGTYNEEITKPRNGTGTYFPKIYPLNREKHLPNKDRHQYGIPASDFAGSEGDGHHTSGRYARPESVHKSSYQSTSHAVMGNSELFSPGGGMTLAMHPPSHLSGMPFPSEHVQFGTYGPVPFCTLPSVRPEPSRNERVLQQSAAPLKQDRLASRSYQLKEEDFPPLSFQGIDRGNFSATGSENSSD